MRPSNQKCFQWSDLVRAEPIGPVDDGIAHGANHDDNADAHYDHEAHDDIDDADDDNDYVHGDFEHDLQNDADDYTRWALGQALTFAERGWRVIPLYGIRQGNCTCKLRNQCDRGAGKHPHFCVHNGLKGADNRAAEIIRWFEKHANLNIGIRTGEQWNGMSLLVIDIDNKIDPVTGKTARELLAELEAELGLLPRSHIIETGSGGLHIYLSYPKGLLIKSSQGKLGY